MPAVTINNIGGGKPLRKRQRQPAEDDQEILDVCGTHSNSRRVSGKRIRISTVSLRKDRRRSTPDSGSDGVEVEEQAGEDTSESPPQTQYEKIRDRGFTHLQNEEADDWMATQRIKRKEERLKSIQLGENHTAENGILEELECINFMCHQNLKIEFGPLLNFIVGENGSGKSAVLTGITLCLGGKASSTNRGGSLKSFVKEGENYSRLIVKIKNMGESAYKHDIYGDTIIVERHFSKSSNSSGFKVKSITGKIISAKRQEVDDIIEYYALQVDNPLNVLSQDNARQFLNASSKGQKYRFFVDGIQLQQLDTDYRLMQEYIERIESKVPDMEGAVRVARAKFDQAKRMKEAIDGNKNLKTKERVLISQMAWVQIRDVEKELDFRKEHFLQKQAELADAHRMMEEKTKELDSVEERIRRKQESIDNKAEGMAPFEEAKEAADDKFKMLHVELQDLHKIERDAHSQFAAGQDRVKELEAKIAEEERKLEEAQGDAPVRLQRELDDSMVEEASLRTELDERRASLDAYCRATVTAIEQAKAALDAVQKKQSEVVTSEKKIKMLGTDGGGKYAGFATRIPDLLRLIDNERGWERKPVGPFGASIQLTDPKWSNILEAEFGATLNSFVVSSHHDAKILQGFIKRLNMKQIPVLIAHSWDRPLDLSGKEPEAEFKTVLRVLNFDELVVRDQLIISKSIEQIILIKDRHQAEEVMHDGAPPRNVKLCLTFHDGKPGQGLRLTSRKSSGIATEPLNVRLDARPRMRTDLTSQLTLAKEAHQYLAHELETLNFEKQRCEQNKRKVQTEEVQQKRNMEGLRNTITKVGARIQRIEGELDKFDGTDGRLQGLKEELMKAKDDVQHYGTQLGELLLRKGDKNTEAEAAKREQKRRKRDLDHTAENLAKAKEDLARLNHLRGVQVRLKNEAFANIALCEEEIERAQKKRDSKAEQVKDWTETAYQMSPNRPEILETDKLDEVKRQLSAVKNQLEKLEQRRGMSDEEALNQYDTRKREARSAIESLSSNKDLINRMSLTLDLRLERWRKFQRYITAAARSSFQYLLYHRGYRGKLLIDHKRKNIDVLVEPERAEKRVTNRTTKTLSGGEKSFSSICLLLAIWEAMGSPLRCLDEFDVFMDNVNRAVSTDMLIKTARHSVNRQYIFITPNAIEGRNNLGKDVKIHRMTDPRQRQIDDYQNGTED